VLQHPGNAYISGYELALRHSNDTWVFEIAWFFFFGKFVDPSYIVYM
jgi:hypothetical protein